MRNPSHLNASDAAYAVRELHFRANADPEMIDLYDQLAEQAERIGIRIGIAHLGGVRTRAETELALKYRRDDWAAAVKKDPTLPLRTTMEKWRPVTAYETSYHPTGCAVDAFIVSYPDGKSQQWAHDELDKIGATLVSRREKIRLQSGDAFRDEPHWQLAITLAEAKRRAAARGSLPCPACRGRGRVGYEP